MMHRPRRGQPAQAGIAIGPILMVIALIGVIIAALSAGGNSLGGSAIRQDRIIADLRGQIDLIRAKVGECVMLTRQAGSPQFLYPGYDQLGTAIPVANLTCPRDPAGALQNLWTGVRPASLPPVPKGFNAWQYVNRLNPDDVGSAGSVCIRIQPVDPNDAMVKAAMAAIIKRFSPDEYTFDSTTQQLIIWLQRPVSGTAC